MLVKMGLADHPQEPWSGVRVAFAAGGAGQSPRWMMIFWMSEVPS